MRITLDTNSTNKRTRQQSLYLEILLIVRTCPSKKKRKRGNERKKTVWRIERHIFTHVHRHKKTLLNTSPQNERVIRGSEIE